MSNPNQNKPGGKPGQRSRKPVQEVSLKAVQPQSQKPVQQLSQKPEQQLSQKPEQQRDGKQQIAAAVASTDASPIDAVAPANTLAVDFHTIATAYSDYTRKSFEDTKAFVEKLSGVRSLDKAIEIQTEFAKQAYETFVTESQKIRELYSGLAKQTFKPLEGLVAKTTQAAR